MSELGFGGAVFPSNIWQNNWQNGFMHLFRPITLALLSSAMACAPAPDAPPTAVPAAAPPESQVLQSENGVETLATGACVARTAPRTATVVISEQVEVAPAVLAPDGTVISEAIFRNQTRPVEEVLDEGTRFETLCPFEYTPERLMTLQRALKARLVYTGPITGVMDDATRAAIQEVQAPLGFDSPILERGTAQIFGIIPFDLPDPATE